MKSLDNNNSLTPILVIDTNIIIDLVKIGMLDNLFRTEFKIVVPECVIGELGPAENINIAQKIYNGSLKVHKFQDEEYLTISNLYEKSGALSFNDSTILYLVKKLGASLVSGDLSLRKNAILSKLPVKGLLWILDYFHEKDFIDSATYVKTLVNIKHSTIRIPKSEIEKRIRLLTDNK